MRGRQQVSALRQRLDAAFKRATQVAALDAELQSDYAKYLCVLVSGYFETCVSEITIEHCRARSQQTVSNFTGSELARPQNLKTDRLLKLIGAFSVQWRHETEAYIDGRRKDALNGVVDLRNKIAHGETVTLTYSRIKDYDDAVEEILQFILAKFN